MKATIANNGERVVLTNNTRDLGHGVQIEVIYQDGTKGWEHEEDLIDREIFGNNGSFSEHTEELNNK